MQKNQEEILDLLKRIRMEKDVDQIGEMFLAIINTFGLRVDEVCAIAYYLIDTTLKAKHNEDGLAKRFGIDIDKLGIDGKFTIAKAMIITYAEKAAKDGKA